MGQQEKQQCGPSLEFQGPGLGGSKLPSWSSPLGLWGGHGQQYSPALHSGTSPYPVLFLLLTSRRIGRWHCSSIWALGLTLLGPLGPAPSSRQDPEPAASLGRQGGVRPVWGTRALPHL